MIDKYKLMKDATFVSFNCPVCDANLWIRNYCPTIGVEQHAHCTSCGYDEPCSDCNEVIE